MQYKRFGLIAAAVAVATLALSGCTSTGSETQASAATTTPSSVTPSSTADAQAHNDADVAFATGMTPHHQQAVEMSDMLLAKQGIDPQVVSLANDIKAAQGPEIEQMQGWLTQWGAATTPSPSGMPGHDMPGHDMPGMSGGHGIMSQADMTALQNAQGADASRLFLTQMIEHHNGAITMAQQEIDGGQFPAAVEMARSIVTSQQQEITSMQGILDSM